MKKVKRLFALVLAFTMLFATATSVFAASEIREVGSEYYYKDADGNWTLEHSYSSKYNKNGSITKSTSKSRDYDTKKMITSVTTYKSGYSVTKKAGVNSSKTKYGSNKNTNYTWNKKTKKWVKSGFEKFSIKKNKSVWKEYDKKSKLISRSVSTTSKKKRTYTSYDGKGKVTNKSTTKLDSKGNAVEETWISYYDGKAHKTTVKRTLNKYGLPTKEVYIDEYGKTTYTFKYSNYYKNNKKYPQKTIRYYNGTAISMTKTKYKKFSF